MKVCLGFYMVAKTTDYVLLHNPKNGNYIVKDVMTYQDKWNDFRRCKIIGVYDSQRTAYEAMREINK